MATATVHRHPLESSLAPYGYVFPIRQKRLADEIPVNEERVIGGLWEKLHLTSAPRPHPIEEIVHTILPRRSLKYVVTKGNFEYLGLPYLRRDILVLSSSVQWFGTNVGRWFIEEDISSSRGFRPEIEFEMKLKREAERKDLVSFLIHECTGECTPRTGFGMFSGGCRYLPEKMVPKRDRALVDGLMLWLGTERGRAFLKEFKNMKVELWEAVNEQRRKKLKGT